MSGLYYAVFVLAILVVIWWLIQNERVGPNSDGSRGFLAIRSPDKTNNSVRPDVQRARTPTNEPKQPVSPSEH